MGRVRGRVHGWHVSCTDQVIRDGNRPDQDIRLTADLADERRTESVSVT